MSESDTPADYAAAPHYDRVIPAWQYLLGDELHYGVFPTGTESLSAATAELTERMASAAQLAPGLRVLDVGCGTGTPACAIAADHGVEVHGISTSEVGVAAARERAAAAGLTDRVSFSVADGMANGLPDASFDRVWVLESSHLMPERDRLIAECARVLRPGGRVALCDIVLRRDVTVLEIRRRLREFQVLRQVFGAARMDPLESYAAMMRHAGLEVVAQEDITALTAPTFARWRDNAAANHAQVSGLLGTDDYDAFVESTRVLDSFWADRTLGYGIIAATKPA